MSEVEKKMLVDMEDVLFVAWDEAKGLRLMQLRGKKARRELAEDIAKVGGDGSCSHQNLKKLEYGNSKMVSISVLQAICRALGVPISEFVRAYTLTIPKAS